MTKPWWKEPTRAQWAAFAAAWVGWVLDAFDFTIYICVAGSIIKEFGVSPTAVAGSLTLTLLVRLVGGMVAGWIADRWGRKLPLMMSLVWFAVFDAAIYFAPTFGWLLVLRTLFGFGMGAEWTAGTALAMESFPPRGRRFASGLLQAGWPVGFLLAALTAYFVVPAYGWRAMFLIAAVPAVLVIPIRMFVPDELAHAKSAAHSRGALRDLAAPAVRKMLVLGSIVMALGFIVYYGMTTSYMGLHHELGMTPAQGWVDLIWFNVGMLAGVIAAGWIANRFGVIVALVAPALLMVVALPLFVGVAPGAMAVGAFLGGALGVGYSGVTPVLTTSLFPEHVRARAIGIVYHVGALIAAFVPAAIPWLASTAGWTLATTIAIVVGGGLVAMSAAVLVLRHSIVPAPIRTHDVPSVRVKLPARNSALVATNGHELDFSSPHERAEHSVELRS
ncbi:MAG TPA: MFS transporter [Kofleriaceae bacterium]|nr:MFS transporter [Kofleriaceae bacterium]